jgi:MFS superfamily sulfate permease-like transporter
MAAMFHPSFLKALPSIGIDCGIGIVALALFLAWWRITGRVFDRDSTRLLGRIILIVLFFGLLLAFYLAGHS